MAMTLITTNTSSNAATSDFTSGIDSTYKLYIFKFYDVNPATDGTDFTFNGSIDGGSNYNVTKTTSIFRAFHGENDSNTGLDYEAVEDIAQGTGFQNLSFYCGADADEHTAGTLWLFNPSNTTYVKHFYSTVQMIQGGEGIDSTQNIFTAGYFNDTNDIDAVQFKMSSGNMDAVIKMYGVG
jgi:hypothetical protein